MAKRTTLPSLPLHASVQLEADGNFDSESLATTRLSNATPIVVNRTWFHLELLEVDEEGYAVNPSLQENVDAVRLLCGARPATMRVKGRNYIAVMFPHED